MGKPMHVGIIIMCSCCPSALPAYNIFDSGTDYSLDTPPYALTSGILAPWANHLPEGQKMLAEFTSGWPIQKY